MSRAFRRAAHWFGLVCLAGALIAVIALSAQFPSDGIWPTIIAIVPMAILLATLTGQTSMVAAAGYLLIGGLSTFVYALTILSDDRAFITSDMFVVTLPAMALVMVGGVGAGAFVGVVWASAGLIVGEGAIFAACLVSGDPFRLDWFVPITYLTLVGVLILEGASRGRGRVAQAAILRAARDSDAFTLRRDLEARATSHLHDTTLSHLMAIAGSAAGPLDPRTRHRIARDLEQLVGGDWLVPDTRGATGWRTTPLSEAVDAARADGLRVEVAGDREAVTALPAEVGSALGSAVRQCLANVLRHSGVTSAEVAIMNGADDLTVMVTDAGDGFHPEADTDRIGLRHSVHGRLREVGGEVQVWSRPGAGTTVMLSAPHRFTAVTASVAVIVGTDAAALPRSTSSPADGGNR